MSGKRSARQSQELSEVANAGTSGKEVEIQHATKGPKMVTEPGPSAFDGLRTTIAHPNQAFEKKIYSEEEKHDILGARYHKREAESKKYYDKETKTWVPTKFHCNWERDMKRLEFELENRYKWFEGSANSPAVGRGDEQDTDREMKE